VLAERALLRTLGGGCQVPIGADTSVAGEMLHLRGAVLAPDGTRRIEAAALGALADPETLGRQLAEELWRRGAADLLAGRS